MPPGFLRLNSLGSPFRMIDAGYAEDDTENNNLLQQGTENYIKSLEENVQLDRSMYSNLHKFSPFLYPVAAGGLGWLVAKNYTRPRSIYARGLSIGFTAFMGWWTSMRTKSREHDIFMMKNYKHFGKEMRDALATGDARYIRHWHSGPKK